MTYLKENDLLDIGQNVRLFSTEEKDMHEIGKVPYASIAALKIGKLAVNKELSDTARCKGYGSFMLELARAYAFQMNTMGVACRFITVDADIEFNADTPNFDTLSV